MRPKAAAACSGDSRGRVPRIWAEIAAAEAGPVVTHAYIRDIHL